MPSLAQTCMPAVLLMALPNANARRMGCPLVGTARGRGTVRRRRVLGGAPTGYSEY